MNTMNDNGGKSPSIAGWLARILHVKESTMQCFLTIVVMFGVALMVPSFWKVWTSAYQELILLNCHGGSPAPRSSALRTSAPAPAADASKTTNPVPAAPAGQEESR